MQTKAEGWIMARPSIFTAGIADTICDRIANGESLRTICNDEEMPGQTTVFRWLAQNEEFREQYTRARESQADALFDEILDIADNSSNDWMIAHGDDDEGAGWRQNSEAIRRSQMRIDARKWMAGKLRPKKYGDKVIAEHSGPDGGPIEVAETLNVSSGVAKALEALRAAKG